MLRKVTHCAGHVSANTRPHQLRWGDHAWLLCFRVIEQLSNMYFQVSNKSRNNLPASIIVRNELLIIPHAGSLYININTYNFMCLGECFSIQVSTGQNSHVGMPHRRLNVQMLEKENFK